MAGCHGYGSWRARSRAGGLMAAVLPAIGLAPMAALPLSAQDMDDVTAVRRVAQEYLDGLAAGDAAMLSRAFAPEAQLFGAPGRALQVIPVKSWIESRKGKRLEPAGEYVQRVVSVDVSGDAALAKTDLVWPALHYVDYLSLVRIGGEWRIVNKIWHQEPSPEALAGIEMERLRSGEADRYVGTYATEKTRFEVVKQGKELRIRLGPQEYRLFYQGEGTFAPEFDVRMRLHFVMEGGKATEIAIQQGDTSSTAKRTG